MKSRIHAIRTAALAVALSSPFAAVGCTLTSDQGDMDYPTFGGAWQRTRPDSGRVGSIFDPAGARLATLSPKSPPRMEENERSAGESIPSVPPENLPGKSKAPDKGRQPRDPEQPDNSASPSDRLGSERLRKLELHQTGIEPGEPAPPDLQ
jgi:hypothetical protein